MKKLILLFILTITCCCVSTANTQDDNTFDIVISNEITGGNPYQNDDTHHDGGTRSIKTTLKASIKDNLLSVYVYNYIGDVEIYIYNNAGNLLSTFTGYANGKTVVSGNIDYDPNESYTIRIQLDGGAYVGHF